MTTQAALDTTLASLLVDDENSLLERLGIRAKAVQAGNPEAMDYAAEPAYDVKVLGAMEDARKLGRQLLTRWNRELYKVMCSDESDSPEDRKSLLDAFGVSDVAAAAAMTSILVASFAVAPAVAAVVSALVVKRLIHPGIEVTCKFWKEKLIPE